MNYEMTAAERKHIDEEKKKIKDVPDSLLQVLTAGTYTDFVKAVREAASNSYDAGATKLEIVIEPATLKKDEKENHEAVIIQLKDNGHGISIEDFYHKFLQIASSKKDPSKRSKLAGNRYPIGKFGIGALAFIPFVNEIKIYSKKKKEKPICCTINARQLHASQKVSWKEGLIGAQKAEYISDESWEQISSKLDSGTIFKITGVTSDTFHYLYNGSPTAEQVKSFVKKPSLTLGQIEIAWELSTILPLAYEEDNGGVYKKLNDGTKPLVSNNPSFEVEFCGLTLKRQIFSQEGCQYFPFNYNHDKMEAKGVIVANPSTVKPAKANGVMLRLNNVGIGSYNFYEQRLKQRSAESRITGEIHLIKGFHNQITNNREGLKLRDKQILDFLKVLLEKLLEAEKGAISLSEASAKNKKETKDKNIAKATKEIIDNVKNTKIIKGREQEAKEKATNTSKPKPIKKKDCKPRQEEHNNPVAKENESKSQLDFEDPIEKFDESGDKLTFNKKHEIFRVSNRGQHLTIEIFLRCLYIAKSAGLSADMYSKIIGDLIALVKAGKK